MKKITSLFLILSTSFILNSTTIENKITIEQGQSVYICTGGSSKRYHSSSTCKGLNNCQANIKEVTKASATQAGRTPCKICY